MIANQELLRTLVVRDVLGRYRGSTFGLLWSFFNPILMLAVFTFVFSVVFQARWGEGSGSKTEFAMALFAGLIAFNFFSECMTRAPTLILSNVGYVKKVVFPLEILPVVAAGSALFHLLVNFIVWIVFHTLLIKMPPITILLAPIVMLPLFTVVLGLSWLLASLGVFLRDVNQVIGVFVLVLLYLSPIFYPISAMPAAYRPYMQASPLTSTVEQLRHVMMWGRGIDWFDWLGSMAIALVVAAFGYAWFQKTRRGFADVL